MKVFFFFGKVFTASFSVNLSKEFSQLLVIVCNGQVEKFTIKNHDTSYRIVSYYMAVVLNVDY